MGFFAWLASWFRSPPSPPSSVRFVPPHATAAPIDSVSFLLLLNAERARRSLEPLALNVELSAVAQSWADSMARADDLKHGDFPARIGASFPSRAAAENIAMGHSDAQSTYAQWAGSPAHAANMVGPYTLCGIARSYSASGAPYWCADFVA